MKTFDPQAMYSEWMSQLVNHNPWQEWMKPATSVVHLPILDVLKEAGATINPTALAQLQADYMREFGQLWQSFTVSKLPELNDKRFSAKDWHNHAMHSYSAASYLLNARFLMSLAESVEAPAKIKQKIGFAVQQMIDALSPANFLVTNPEAQSKLIETKGESLAKGITQMLADMQKGRISQTDESAFEVGKNVATTEGVVVFENRLFQLIQYTPLTKTVHQRPLLMVPPCINKFYILDLQPENSLVRYGVEQGNTVFLVSWVNPDASLKQATWDDYIQNGAIKAIEVVREISGQDQINTLGFCVGGTILATALSVMLGRGEKPAASITLLTTLLDFSDTGVLEVYIDEDQVSRRECEIGKGGMMPGRDFTAAFSSLRPNDLVWNYVEQSYLKGVEPPAFDLLYWNADATNLPGPMFCYYLRNMYLENNLREPGKLSVGGQSVDLGRIDMPAFLYASREDHIVPWQAAYETLNLINTKNRAKSRFVLGASGHIA